MQMCLKAGIALITALRCHSTMFIPRSTAIQTHFISCFHLEFTSPTCNQKVIKRALAFCLPVPVNKGGQRIKCKRAWEINCSAVMLVFPTLSYYTRLPRQSESSQQGKSKQGSDLSLFFCSAVNTLMLNCFGFGF